MESNTFLQISHEINKGMSRFLSSKVKIEKGTVDKVGSESNREDIGKLVTRFMIQ